MIVKIQGFRYGAASIFNFITAQTSATLRGVELAFIKLKTLAALPREP